MKVVLLDERAEMKSGHHTLPTNQVDVMRTLSAQHCKSGATIKYGIMIILEYKSSCAGLL